MRTLVEPRASGGTKAVRGGGEFLEKLDGGRRVGNHQGALVSRVFGTPFAYTRVQSQLSLDHGPPRISRGVDSQPLSVAVPLKQSMCRELARTHNHQPKSDGRPALHPRHASDGRHDSRDACGRAHRRGNSAALSLPRGRRHPRGAGVRSLARKRGGLSAGER